MSAIFYGKLYEKDNWKNKIDANCEKWWEKFPSFFLDFTIIFFALTVIILQVLTSGVYKSTDQNLRDLAANPDILRALALDQAGVNQGTFEINQGNYSPTNSIVMYDEKGNVLGPTGSVDATTKP